MKSRFLLMTAAIMVIAMNLQAQVTGTFTDSRDGKVYKTVKIGNQLWMAENLNYDAGESSWCYDNNMENGKKYGRLYTWDAARKAVPKGWHLPSKEEFETLLKNLGGSDSVAYKQIIPGGISGFNALFGGWRNDNGNFANVGKDTYFWSKSEYEDENAGYLLVRSGYKKAYLDSNYKTIGFSVRLLKD
jgi:uncharacterized protein (TIGR02145 family)